MVFWGKKYLLTSVFLTLVNFLKIQLFVLLVQVVVVLPICLISIPSIVCHFRKTSKLVPAELRVNTHEWALDELQHPTVAARKILLRKIDQEMRKAGLIRDHPKIIKRIALSDKVENYKTMDKAVSLG